MFNLVIKTVIIYLTIIFAMRVMGKRQLSQMQPYELVIAILIAEVTSTPMDTPGTPIFYGLIPAITLIILYYLISQISLKSKVLRKLFEGKPSIVINKGVICTDELSKIGYNVSDLLEQVRIAGYMDISEINYAILETGGDLSVFPIEKNRSVTLSDLEIQPKTAYLSYPIILDGAYEEESLLHSGIKKDDISEVLELSGIKDIKKVFYLSVSNGTDVFLQLKNGKTKNLYLKRKGAKSCTSERQL